MLYFVPLERLEERYTEQMYHWCMKSLNKRNINFTVIPGDALVTVTEGDQFLSWASRVYFCASQNQRIAFLFEKGVIQDGDVFFIADFWHIGVEGIRYMADMLDIDVKIYGINYAGPFEKSDLLRKTLPWGGFQEAAWYSMFDGVFVGGEDHKDQIQRGLNRMHLPVHPRVHVTGLVYSPYDIYERSTKGKFKSDGRPTVLWPHRLSPEKHVEKFYEIVRDFEREFYPDVVRWVISSSRDGQVYEPEDDRVEFITQSKDDYYAMMRHSKLVLSTSEHDTFGYVIREATDLVVPILYPYQSNYKETILTPINLYSSHIECLSKISMAVKGKLPVATIKQTGGFEQMLDIMEVE